jgi:beta-galactosidase
MTSGRASARARASKPETPLLAGNALVLGSKRVPLYSGAMHYFRLKPSAWQAGLEAIKTLGLPMVETYVPWGVHETSEDHWDFGEQDPRKNLGAFLDLAHSLGLYVFLRPGPHINAELTYFGLPPRIIFDEACQARSPRGHAVPFIAPPRMFPVPSYASERFLAETKRWFGAVAEVVRPRLWPDGPVVLLQVDNEIAFYFRDAPFDQDYHPDAIAKYRAFLQQRHASLDALNAAYETRHEHWNQVSPPHRFESGARSELRRQLDYMAFHEELLGGALTQMRAALHAHGLGSVPFVHNLPMGEGGLPATLARIDRSVDITGLDYYHRAADLRTVKERTLRLAGSVRVPYSPEMGIGSSPWLTARSDADSLTTMMCACAYGLRGVNLYMAIDRDRWYGAPFDEEGRPRAHAPQLTRFFEALTNVAFHTLQRRVEVAIVIPKEYEYLTRATHTLGAISPCLLDLSGAGASAASLQDSFGFSAPIQTQWSRWVARIAKALELAAVPYVYVESDAVEQPIAGLRVLFVPSYEFADRARWERVLRFSAAGGHVVYGPRLPELDTQLSAHAFAEPRNARRVEIHDQTDADRIVHAVVNDLDLARPFPAAPRTLQTAVHCEGGTAKLLFVIQPEANAVGAEVRVPEPMALVDALTGERYEGETTIGFPISGHSCRMFFCERSSQLTPHPKPASARRSVPPC